MSKLVMLPITQLHHHPDNPRKDLGDLKELTASIRESGIMQNLTVVPTDEDGYWVVIGNRRMEAAKAAGVTELPCIVSEMDYKTQIATMMLENMQRVDLTIMEQAQGVQMMMDLGMDEKEISLKTGLRKDTIRRRAALTKYDAEKVRKGFARGATLQDFAALDEIREPENREKLLEMVGTASYQSELQYTKKRESRLRRIEALTAKLDAFATQIERCGYVGAKVVPMRYIRAWYDLTEKDVRDYQQPDDLKDAHYYWLQAQPDGQVTLYREQTANDPADEKERLEAVKRDWMRKQRQKAEELHQALRETRYQFLFTSPAISYDDRVILKAYVMAMGLHMTGAAMDAYSRERFSELTGISAKESGYSIKLNPKELKRATEIKLAPAAVALIWAMLDQPRHTPWVNSWDSYDGLGYKNCEQLELLYWLLTSLGYVMSEEEERYICGTHEIFRRWEDGGAANGPTG